VVFRQRARPKYLVPMGQTFSVFFYRSDLVSRRSAEDAGTARHHEQEAAGDGKVKFGYAPAWR